MENLVIKGREVMNIIKTTQPEKEYSKESKLAGQKYNTFAYGGKAFTANTVDGFTKLQKEGKLYSVTLGVNEEGQLSLLSYTTQEQEIAMVKFESQMKRIENIANISATETLTEEKLAALLAQ